MSNIGHFVINVLSKNSQSLLLSHDLSVVLFMSLVVYQEPLQHSVSSVCVCVVGLYQLPLDFLVCSTEVVGAVNVQIHRNTF